jgi:hypothetical protein
MAHFPLESLRPLPKSVPLWSILLPVVEPGRMLHTLVERLRELQGIDKLRVETGRHLDTLQTPGQYKSLLSLAAGHHGVLPYNTRRARGT